MKIEMGKVYRAKTPRNVGGLVNDRIVLWVSNEHLQYDSPSVASGRRYPWITIQNFEKWAGSQVEASEASCIGTWETWEGYMAKRRELRGAK